MRSLKFRDSGHDRHWWHRLADTNYVPPIFSALSESEWDLLSAWFDDTETRFSNPGEIGVPGISVILALIGGNGLSAIVQCGHYVGFSTLMIGFLLRSMGKKKALLSIDIDPMSTNYTLEWIGRAGLGDYIELRLANSSDHSLVPYAREYFGDLPQMVFIDSSHQYAHTLEELDLWYDAVTPGGFLVMHDVSEHARSFDPTRRGGVLGAVREWSERRGVAAMLLNSFQDGSHAIQDLTYRDSCGLGLIQKPIN
jgi:predicted O-methyltransferase YrrM